MNDDQKAYYQKLYEELSKKYTKEELVEAFVFPSDMSEDEHKEANSQLRKDRLRRLANRTPEEKILSGLLRIKYQMKDYIKQNQFDENKSVAHFLNEYLKVIDKKQKKLAEDIGVHVTRLSRILNEKEKLSLSIAYRLEAHSGDLIPAIMWWKLVQKEVEQEIKTDEEKRKKEKDKVKNIVYQRA
jgi:plasmid maintenance system antidote protein VapI